MVPYEEINRTSTASLTTFDNSTWNPFAITDDSFEDENENNQILFKDFEEPELRKTGYLIPLSCGHNGNYSEEEITMLEIHLTSAGFISY